MYIYPDMEARSCNHCCRGKEVSMTQPECVFVAIGIQHAMRKRRIMICDLHRSTYFSTLSHKLHDFRKKKLCASIFSTNFI